MLRMAKLELLKIFRSQWLSLVSIQEPWTNFILKSCCKLSRSNDPDCRRFTIHPDRRDLNISSKLGPISSLSEIPDEQISSVLFTMRSIASSTESICTFSWSSVKSSPSNSSLAESFSRDPFRVLALKKSFPSSRPRNLRGFSHCPSYFTYPHLLSAKDTSSRLRGFVTFMGLSLNPTESSAYITISTPCFLPACTHARPRRFVRIGDVGAPWGNPINPLIQ
jgi:hypothetical protein